MAYERKEGDISLFRNENKKEDKHPDFRGKALVDGVLRNVSLWVRSGEKGNFFTGRIETATDKQESVPVETVDSMLQPTAKKIEEAEVLPMPIEVQDDLPF